MIKHIEYIICDVCNEKINDESRIIINCHVGNIVDPAGGHGERDIESFDLCSKCCNKHIIPHLMKKLKTFEENQELVEIIKTKRNKK